MIRQSTLVFTATLLFCAGLFAQSQSQTTAKAELKKAGGESVGSVVLTGTPSGVLMQLNLTGLPPGEHGFHVHEVGSCQAPDFKSAGGHFNPTKKQHGFQQMTGHHSGDISNLTVAKDGTVKAEVFLEGVQLGGGDASLMKTNGTALVVHAKADDYKTDPSGDSGDRIACGVIQRQ
jgi:superoxide dismutase, Cu-Zn family